MTLTAIRPSCWSGKLALNLDGRAIGAAEPRTWSGGYDLRLTGGRRLRFGKPPESRWWQDRRLVLTEAEGGAILARGERVGTWKSHWVLDLSAGPATLRTASVWNSGRMILGDADEDAPPAGEVTWLSRKASGAAGGWRAETAAGAALTPTDLLLAGLTYQTIRNRQAAAAAGAGAA